MGDKTRPAPCPCGVLCESPQYDSYTPSFADLEWFTFLHECYAAPARCLAAEVLS